MQPGSPSVNRLGPQPRPPKPGRESVMNCPDQSPRLLCGRRSSSRILLVVLVLGSAMKRRPELSAEGWVAKKPRSAAAKWLGRACSGRQSSYPIAPQAAQSNQLFWWRWKDHETRTTVILSGESIAFVGMISCGRQIVKQTRSLDRLVSTRD